MRIIGGRFGGRRIKAPSGATTRPTSDRVREAIFNIMGPPAPHVRVLDAFAGAGTLGLEAISRGAREACFIEKSSAALRVLRGNIEALGVAQSCQIIRGSALSVVARYRSDRRSSAPSSRFDWIFIDPPYRSDLARELLGTLGSGALLSRDAIVVVEHDRRNQPDPACGCLVRTDHRQYGDTSVSFYRQSTGNRSEASTEGSQHTAEASTENGQGSARAAIGRPKKGDPP